MPFINPLTTSGLAAPVTLAPPGEATTVYPVIVAPPLEEGEVKLTDTRSWPGAPTTPVGAPGTVSDDDESCETTTD